MFFARNPMCFDYPLHPLKGVGLQRTGGKSCQLVRFGLEIRNKPPKFVPMNPATIRIPQPPRKPEADLTPREVQFLRRPAIQELIQRLQCDVLPSVNLRRAKLIRDRIDLWVNQAAVASDLAQEQLSATQRYSDSSILDFVAQNARIEAVQVAFHGPRPWSYPLTKAPF